MNPRPFNAARFDRAKDLSLCIRCCILFTDPKNEDILLEPHDVIAQYLTKHKLLPTDEVPIIFSCSRDAVCPCCMGYLHPAVLSEIAMKILDSMRQHLVMLPGEVLDSTCLVLDFPTTFDVLRIGIRTIITRIPEKTDPFPSFSELLYRLLGKLLGTLGNVTVLDEAVAKNKVVVTMRLSREGDVCRLLCPYCFDFYKKSGGKDQSLKRTVGQMEAGEIGDSNLYSESNEVVPRKFLDFIIIENKRNANNKDLLEMQHRIRTFYSVPKGTKREFAKVDIVSFKTPVYLLGRYRKLSRDVPQSRWDVDAKVAVGMDQKFEVNSSVRRGSVAGPETEVVEIGSRVRMGRNSVEEIIVDSIAHAIGTHVSNLKMHGCGREDIDVRMLGNGRPFVVEALNLKMGLTSTQLDHALKRVAAGDGLNSNFDLEVTWLSEVPKSVWEGMQTVAEEKCKAYCCVIWCEKTINSKILDEKLGQLPMRCGTFDEDGIPGLEIEQLTPLRVLHRRSLLNRKRFIYSMNAIPLNDHYFLLHVVTSAGTYVKEFVHGDFGRSEPSIAGVLGCKADITQLDVTWLYDDFGDSNWRQNFSVLPCNGNQKSTTIFPSASLAVELANRADRKVNCTKEKPQEKALALSYVKEAGNSILWNDLRKLMESATGNMSKRALQKN